MTMLIAVLDSAMSDPGTFWKMPGGFFMPRRNLLWLTIFARTLSQQPGDVLDYSAGCPFENRLQCSEKFHPGFLGNPVRFARRTKSVVRLEQSL